MFRWALFFLVLVRPVSLVLGTRVTLYHSFIGKGSDVIQNIPERLQESQPIIVKLH